MRQKRTRAIKPGKVQRIIKPAHRDDVEKAEITINDADHLYKEIRIENTLRDEKHKPVKLKPGADVDIVVEADPNATVPKEKPEK